LSIRELYVLIKWFNEVEEKLLYMQYLQKYIYIYKLLIKKKKILIKLINLFIYLIYFVNNI